MPLLSLWEAEQWQPNSNGTRELMEWGGGWDFRGIGQRYLAPLPVFHYTRPEIPELRPTNCPSCPLLV
jgi:hypothetical protein